MSMSEEGRRAVAEANRNRVWTEEQKRAIGEGNTGPKTWFANLSPEERAAYSQKLSEAQTKRHRERPEELGQVGRKVAAAWTPERRVQMSKAATLENYRRVEVGEHPFQSEENKALTGSLGIKSLATRGKTLEEVMLGGVLDEVVPGEFRFNDGWFELAGKAPDFPNINGKKLLVEMFGSSYHSWDEPPLRQAVFEPYGYRTLIVWDYEIGQTGLRRRIERFVWPHWYTRFCRRIFKAVREVRPWRS